MKWLRRGLWVCVGALAVFSIVIGYLVCRSLPVYDRSVIVTGISGPVHIARSVYAVPNISGENDPDVFFGLGYAHAQDRLWQMELMRRTAQGRLSERLGSKTVRTDELLRRLDLYGAAESSLSSQDTYTQMALAAYSAGVNARISETTGWGEAGPEFLLFSAPIEPWTPQDSLALMKLMAMQLVSHADREVLRARVSRLVTVDRLRDILPDDPSMGYAALPQFADLFPDLPPDKGYAQAALTPFLDTGSSSNAWAVGPNRSTAGASLMANDPHLNFSAPTVWYLARLNLASGYVVGGTIPGIPVMLSGQTALLGWGLTTANIDDQDVFIERLNPDNPDEVLTPDGFRPMRLRHETIVVKGSTPVELDLKWTENGPVIPGDFYNLVAITPPGHVASVARTLLDPADTSMTAAMHLMLAGTVIEALGAMESFVAPAQNLTVVDHDHIALQLIGKMPKRQSGHNTLGRMPSEGWLAENRWQGTLPYSDNPRFIDPASDALGNTNNKTIDRAFPLHVSFDWGDTQRIQRLVERIAAQEKHDMESFASIQNDAVSHSAQVLAPLIMAAVGPSEGDRARALDLIGEWDGTMDAARAEPLIWTAWMRELQQQLIADELGPLSDSFPLPNPVFLERVFRDQDGAAIWCDDTSTPARESCSLVAGIALDSALEELTVQSGRDFAALLWGDLHQVLHDHQVLGQVPILGWMVNIHQPSGGGDDTLLRGLTVGTGPQPYANIHGAGYRGIYDMASPENSAFITSTGQSGHFLSAHYRDLGHIWAAGHYLPMILDLETPDIETVGETLLLPR